MTSSTVRMWGLIDDSGINGVYQTRNAARLAKLGGVHGSIRAVLVSLA